MVGDRDLRELEVRRSEDTSFAPKYPLKDPLLLGGQSAPP